MNRHDLAAATSLLARTVELMPNHDPRRPELLHRLGTALQDHGEFARSDEVIQELTAEARRTGDRGFELRAQLLGALRWDVTTPWEERRAVADEAIPYFEERGDNLALYYARQLLAGIHWVQGRSAEGAAEIQRMLEVGRRAAVPDEAFLLHWLAGALLWGPTPAEEALLQCDDLLARAAGMRFAEGSILAARAPLLAMVGRIEEARATSDRAVALLADLGGVLPAVIIGTRIELMEEILGEHERAVEITRPQADLLSRMGEKSFFSTVAYQLAHALALSGHLDEAEEYANKSREAAPADDWVSQVGWREGLCMVAAGRGELEEAERWAREALAMCEGVDYITQIADVWSELAAVLRRAGRTEEAREALRAALSLREAKGNVVSAARAREALATLEA
jgi:tetratricopeptide (TPR) repeat protein